MGSISPPADTTIPTAPTNLAASAASATQINLTWTASTDNVGVSGYRLERCQGAGCGTFVQIATLAGTSFSDTGLSAATSYSYRVRASDAAGNLSVYANVTSATTGVAAAAQIYYIQPDHLGTPRRVANGTGTTVWRWDQREPFGDDVPNNNPSEGGAFDSPLRFPGQYFDREANLSYNYFRAYDPAIGRYVQSDPIGLRGGINTYLYVGGNPISRIDPSGLYCLTDAEIGAVAGAIGGGFGGAVTGFTVGGVPGMVALGALGAGAGGLAGALSNTATNAMVGGAASGALGGANSPMGGAVGGLIGGAASDFAQGSGVPSGASMIIGGGLGGAIGGAMGGWLGGTAIAGMTTGGLIGLSSAALTAGIIEALKAGNNCACVPK